MSYFTVSHDTRVQFENSASLDHAIYRPTESAIYVAYKRNVDFHYIHEGCNWDEFNHLLSLIESKQSGYHGYNAWKQGRKTKLQAKDKRQFTELWDGLNEYQRNNLIEFVQEQKVPHWEITRVPIYRRNPWS